MLAQHPDPTVDHVLKTWAPRMIVQGIDYNDLMTTGAPLRHYVSASKPALPCANFSRCNSGSWSRSGTTTTLSILRGTA